MDGTGSAAHVAACIVQKNWGMLRGILAGTGSREDALAVLVAAVRDVPAPRLAEFIREATEKVPEE